MSIIQIEGVSKRYVIGHEMRADTLRDRLEHGAKGLWRSLRGWVPRTLREEFWALRDVSFSVSPGEVVGVIGRNGAGKSTLLKILSRITEPTSGRVTLNGRVASLLEVGTGFHPELTGRENIFLNGAILGMSRMEIRQKFDEIVAFAEVEQFLDTPVKRYSSGMYVRLAFAVAAHLEPEILIIDEVLAVGDANFQNKCLGKMQDVSQRDGRTVLFVSHNLAMISALTSRCVVLSKGSVLFDGNTSAATARYLDEGPPGGGYQGDQKRDPRVESIRLETSEPGGTQAAGKPLRIIITLKHDKPVRGACLSFQIVNQMHQPATHLWTYDADRPMCRTPGTTTLTCTIPKVHLNVGRYTLRVHFTEPPGGQTFEVLEAVCPFEVVRLGETTQWGWRPEACAYHEDAAWEVGDGR